MLRLVRHIQRDNTQQREGSVKSTGRNGAAGNEIGTSSGTSVGNGHHDRKNLAPEMLSGTATSNRRVWCVTAVEIRTEGYGLARGWHLF
jgi:hypothetical protein